MTTALAPAPALYAPAPSLYSGTGVSREVGGRFDCAINGRPYMIDLKSGEYRWGREPRVRDSVDQSSLPGEAAISTQGLWRRAQSTWHLGAGQEWADDADAVPGRFDTSKGVDVWTKGQVSLLPDTAQVLAATGTNLACVSAGTRLYCADGQALKYTTSVTSPSFTSVTGLAAADITGIATNGTFVYVAQGASGIYRTSTAGTTAVTNNTGTVDKIAHVKGRLMVSGGTSIYNVTTTGALPTALFTHPNTGWTWVGFAAGQQHIYAAGYCGATALVYRINLVDDASALAAPVVAAELPRGETIRSIGSYLGFILLGTTKGARFCQADGDGNLVIGALIETDEPVQCFAATGRFAYFGWSQFDGESSGLGRMDLSQFTNNLTPAFASDLMVSSQADVTAAEVHGDQVVFAVSGVGYYTADTDLVASGHLDTGVFTYGLPDAKVLARCDLVTAALDGGARVDVAFDGGAWQSVGSATATGTQHSLTPPQARSYTAAFRLTLSRDGTDATVGPVVQRFNARTFVSPARSRVVQVPVLLHPTVRTLQGADYAMDVRAERAALDDLIAQPRVVAYQEFDDTYDVMVEDVSFLPDNARSGGVWAGTALVVMRTVED